MLDHCLSWVAYYIMKELYDDELASFVFLLFLHEVDI